MVIGADELHGLANEMVIGADGTEQPRQLQLLGFQDAGKFREWPFGLSPAKGIAPGLRGELSATADRRAFLQNLELFTGIALGEASAIYDAEIFPAVSSNDLIVVTAITINGVRCYLGSGFMPGRAFTAAWGYKVSYYGMVDNNGPVVVEVQNIDDTDTIDVSGGFYCATVSQD